jgi:putative ABC transport system permease protein
MNWLHEWRRRLAVLLHRDRWESDLAEEMRLHAELRAGEGAEARRRFGNLGQLQEESRAVWGWAWVDSLWQDIRYGLRTLVSNPGFTATAVLSLALGIGANTAIFTIVNAVMLRSLPVEDPQQLVQIGATRNDVFTNPLWEQIRDHQKPLASTLAFSGERFDLAQGGDRQFVQGTWVSGDYFKVLGVPPFLGRVFTPEDDRHGGGKSGPVAVISHKFWQSHYNGDPDVLGKVIQLDRHPFEIVGVTPPWFTGLDVDSTFDVAIPIGCEPIFHTDRSALDHRSWWWLRVVGRLAPGTSMEQAEAQLKAQSGAIHKATVPEQYEPVDKEAYLRRTLTLRPAATGFSATGGQYRKALFTLMAVVGLVLLIACANIANLLLARAAARQREISIRLAIGAGRRRVIRQLLTESLLLSLLGAAGGLLFARWGSAFLVRLLANSRDKLDLNLSPDLTVLAFTAGIAALTGLLFGLAPAFRATGNSPHQFLKEHHAGGQASRFPLGRLLVAGQVALSLVLLVASGLFVGTMSNLLKEPSGFITQNVLLVSADTLERVPKANRVELFETILERLRGLPGVASASSSALTPISNMQWDQWAYPEGYEPKSRDDRDTFMNRVSPDYFRTLGTPVLLGRDFNDRDTATSAKVVIINERAAREYFANASPLGKMITFDTAPGAKETFEVVGVVKDAKYTNMREAPPRTAYLVASQETDPWSSSNFEIRSAGSIDALIPSIRAAVKTINPGISLEFHKFETQVRDSLLQERTVALLSSFFGALALLLAMIGLYGVTAYSVTRRQSEIGIRVALGAQRGSVIWLVLRDVAIMLAVGVVAGLALSLAAGRLVTSLLYGIRPADPWIIAAAAAILAIATAIAGYLPARRAAALDPTAALREE